MRPGILRVRYNPLLGINFFKVIEGENYFSVHPLMLKNSQLWSKVNETDYECLFDKNEEQNDYINILEVNGESFTFTLDDYFNHFGDLFDHHYPDVTLTLGWEDSFLLECGPLPIAKEKNQFLPIESISLSNFRVLNRADAKGLSSLNLLVGPNGSGKSSIIQALQLFLQPSESPLKLYSTSKQKNHLRSQLINKSHLAEDELNSFQVKAVVNAPLNLFSAKNQQYWDRKHLSIIEELKQTRSNSLSIDYGFLIKRSRDTSLSHIFWPLEISISYFHFRGEYFLKEYQISRITNTSTVPITNIKVSLETDYEISIQTFYDLNELQFFDVFDLPGDTGFLNFFMNLEDHTSHPFSSAIFANNEKKIKKAYTFKFKKEIKQFFQARFIHFFDLIDPLIADINLHNFSSGINSHLVLQYEVESGLKAIFNFEDINDLQEKTADYFSNDELNNMSSNFFTYATPFFINRLFQIGKVELRFTDLNILSVYLPEATEDSFWEVLDNAHKFSQSNKHYFDWVNKWLKHFEIGDSIEIRLFEEIGYSISVFKDNSEINIHNIGTGEAKITIALLKFNNLLKPQGDHPLSGYPPGYYAYMKQKNTLNIWGEFKVVSIIDPEIHLHPSLQSKLADLFVDLSTQYFSSFMLFIETHSEYLIRRMQYLVAKKEIAKEKVSIYYFNKNAQEGEEAVRHIQIQSTGQLTSEFGSGFFDESVNLMVDIFKLGSDN